MRPLRLLISFAASLLALTFLLLVAFGSQEQAEVRSPVRPAKKGKLNALFSFTSPASFFPPSAIISLTDDNSTFFLARPAAFGPFLPSKGLSSPLWIGAGFGGDAMIRAELGCSDVPGWSDGDNTANSKIPAATKKKTKGGLGSIWELPGSAPTKRTLPAETAEDKGTKIGKDDDGTDDHLHRPSPQFRPLGSKSSEHADIESLQESAEIAGKVVLLKRGGCGFLEKVKWAQQRGGVAVIVGDDVRGGPLIRMYAHGDTSNITIPALFTSHTTAQLLSSLLPSGGLLQDLSPEDAAKLEFIKSGKGGKTAKSKENASDSRSTSTKSALGGVQTSNPSLKGSEASSDGHQPNGSEHVGWLRSLLQTLGFGGFERSTSAKDSRRPPSSGNLDWVRVEHWDDDIAAQKPVQTKTSKTWSSIATSTRDSFVIGEQDWRDPDLLPQQTSIHRQPTPSASPEKESVSEGTGGSTLPGSGEYSQGGQAEEIRKQNKGPSEQRKGWFSGWFEDDEEDAPIAKPDSIDGSSPSPSKTAPSVVHAKGDKDAPVDSDQHEGLWVTLTPTNMSTSPFFDTLLVLVVSPLVTLTVVYALLLLRSRIRRRRWRAPKSVVERLPIRTYHTISNSSTPTATPATSSPTTPLLQHSRSRPTSSHSRPRSRTTSEVPAASSSYQNSGRTPEEEKREAGLAEWRRKYGGRQKECVVCLEEYEDGVSRVMSLPCGHEFHADCITPWLVTRRRTCPICKGDVVRSLSQSYQSRGLRSPSPTRSPRFFSNDADSLQAQAAETRNDSDSASRPVPMPGSNADYTDNLYDDVEANWGDDGGEAQVGHAREIPRDRFIDLSSSMRDLSSSVSTTIWRGFEAIRGATGLQGRPSREEVDRDR